MSILSLKFISIINSNKRQILNYTIKNKKDFGIGCKDRVYYEKNVSYAQKNLKNQAEGLGGQEQGGQQVIANQQNSIYYANFINLSSQYSKQNYQTKNSFKLFLISLFIHSLQSLPISYFHIHQFINCILTKTQQQIQITNLKLTAKQQISTINQISYIIMANYMDSWGGRNIFKVSRPPGGGSSISLGWQEPQAKNVRNVSKLRRNQSFVLQPEQQYKKNNYIPTQRKSTLPQPPKNSAFYQPLSSSIPPLPSILNYSSYLSPNFVQPLKVSYSPGFDWGQSTRLLEDQLRYYQDKNRQLREKVGMGINNQELDLMVGQYGGIRRRAINKGKYQGEQLERAMEQQQQQNRSFVNPQYRQQSNLSSYNHYNPTSQNLSNPTSQRFMNQSRLLANYSQIMNNNSGIKTSVKVHGPPGGYSSIKLG